MLIFIPFMLLTTNAIYENRLTFYQTTDYFSNLHITITNRDDYLKVTKKIPYALTIDLNYTFRIVITEYFLI